MITGIVVALSEELNTLTASKLDLGEIAQLSDNIKVIYSGAGAKNAKAAAEQLVQQGATRLISWGCAAALDASLKPGTLIFADACIGVDNTAIETDKLWLQHALSLLANQLPMAGMIAESNQIVATGKDKLELGIATKAIALDMESAAIARVAKASQIPFLAIRAIADPQAMDLPKAVAYAVDAKGQVAVSKLLGYLLRHPNELPALIKLGRHFSKAKKSLKQAAVLIDKIASFAISTKTTTANAS